MASTTRKVTATAPPSWIFEYDAQAYGNSDVVNAGPVSLVWFAATSKSASTLYLMFFDATTVPGNGATPIFLPIPLSTSGLTTAQLSMNDVPGGQRFYALGCTNGLCWAVSTTAGTLTVDATSSVWVTCRYAA